MTCTFRLAAVAAILSALAAPAAHAQFSSNLIVNPGAESALGGDGSSSFAGNLPGWTVTGEMMGIAYSLGCPQGYPCTSPTNPGPAAPGLNHFAGGNVASSTAAQVIDISFAQSQIASGGAAFALSGWLGGYASQGDNVSVTLTFLNASNASLGTSLLGPVSAADRGNATALLLRSVGGTVPTGSTKINVLLTATRVGGGTSNDGYADNLSLVLSPVPEPSTALLAAGGLALLALRCRSRRAA